MENGEQKARDFLKEEKREKKSEEADVTRYVSRPM